MRLALPAKVAEMVQKAVVAGAISGPSNVSQSRTTRALAADDMLAARRWSRGPCSQHGRSLIPSYSSSSEGCVQTTVVSGLTWRAKRWARKRSFLAQYTAVIALWRNEWTLYRRSNLARACHQANRHWAARGDRRRR